MLFQLISVFVAEYLFDLVGNELGLMGLIVEATSLFLFLFLPLLLDVLFDSLPFLFEVARNDFLLFFLVLDVHNPYAGVLDGCHEPFRLGLPALLHQHLHLQLLLLFLLFYSLLLQPLLLLPLELHSSLHPS